MAGKLGINVPIAFSLLYFAHVAFFAFYHLTKECPTAQQEEFTFGAPRFARKQPDFYEADFNGMVPFDCLAFLDRFSQNKTHVKELDPNNGAILGNLSIYDPPFWVSIHNQEYDGMRYPIFLQGKYYERHLTAAFQEILRQDPSARVLDVGGNIGWFTLLSASLGHHVDVFEPNPVNGLRLCQSIRLNGWNNMVPEHLIQSRQPSINYYQIGVGGEDGELDFFVPGASVRNPGMASFHSYPGFIPHKVKVVSLDSVAESRNWFSRNTKIAILKVDVEGYEPEVFAGARKLLQQGLVQNIFMEGGHHNKSDIYPDLLNHGFELYAGGNWLGPAHKFVDRTPEQRMAWIEERERGRGTINLWWKLRDD